MTRYWGVIHALVFNALWFIVVLAVSAPGGELLAISSQVAFVVACLALVWRVDGRHRAMIELRFTAALLALGVIVDGSVARAGYLLFPHTEWFVLGYPLWMLGMWGCFATAFPASLAWIKGRPIAQAMFGGFGGPLSLFAAERFGAVSFPEPLPLTLAIVGIEWAVVMLVAGKLR
jgi:hypothetical protein